MHYSIQINTFSMYFLLLNSRRSLENNLKVPFEKRAIHHFLSILSINLAQGAAIINIIFRLMKFWVVFFFSIPAEKRNL